MYLVLLVLGPVTSLVGLALVISGLAAHDAIDVLTPAMIAIVGGFIVTGLAFMVRELDRIEGTLSAQPMPRASRPVLQSGPLTLATKPAAAALAADQGWPEPQERIPFAPKPKTDIAAQPGMDSALFADPASGAGADLSLEKFPSVVRMDAAVEQTNITVLQRMPNLAHEEDAGTGPEAAVASRTNGAAPADAEPPANANGRAPASRARPTGSVLEAFWPRSPRPRMNFPAAAAANTVQVAAPTEPMARRQPPAANVSAIAPATAPEVAASPQITVLKSGVVEGMSYTLFSDGSIEAQLPQGTLRFGSITELRNHIEKAS